MSKTMAAPARILVILLILLSRPLVRAQVSCPFCVPVPPASGTFCLTATSGALPTWGSCSGSGGGTVTTTGTMTVNALLTSAGTGGTVIQTPFATATLDTSGNAAFTSVTTGSASTPAGSFQCSAGVGTAPSLVSASIQIACPTSGITNYQFVLPAASGSGFLLDTASANIDTLSRVGSTGTGNVVLATGPTLSSPRATTILDGNGNPFLVSSATASAVDSITITNAATANPATITLTASGSDSNINLNLVSKGSGTIQCNGASCGGGGSTFSLTTGMFDPFTGSLASGTEISGAGAAVPAHCGSAGTWCGYQFIVPASMSIPLDNLFMVATGTWLSAEVLQLSVFTDSANAPNTKVSNSDAAVTGLNSCTYCVKSWGSTHPSLTQGVYWLMFSSNTASGTYFSAYFGSTGVNYQNMVFGFSPARYVVCSNTVTYNGASTVHPTSCTSPSAATYTDAIPLIKIVP